MTAREHALATMLGNLRGRMLDARRTRAHAMQDKGAGEAGSVADSLDRAGADLIADVDAALQQMATETLTQIDEALLRLDEGAYGVCEDCGGDIGLARLTALPFAVRCRICEERGDARSPGVDRRSMPAVV